MTESITLSELQRQIKTSIYVGVPDSYWVVAEVSDFKVNYAGHCYLELIEKEANSNSIKAKLRAIIWRNQYFYINNKFVEETGSPINNGVKILVKGSVEYHELYGISFVISDVDITYTIGDMEATRKAIIKRLTDEGVLYMNKELTFPLLPQRIAVVSSSNAAGYTDFINHLHNNEAGYLFKVVLFDSVMQGEGTEESVVSVLNKIADSVDNFDVVAIIRGGGSRSDLSWFDNYNIAYYVTQFPLPVLTGIGHDKDVSVTDMVAYNALKTPTAVANYLIDCFARTEAILDNLSKEIAEKSEDIIAENRQMVESFVSKLKLSATQLTIIQDKRLNYLKENIIRLGRSMVYKSSVGIEKFNTRLNMSRKTRCNAAKEMLDNKTLRLHDKTKVFLEKNSSRIKELETRLNYLDPQNVVARGYTISYKDGKIIKSISDLQEGSIIRTRFRDGYADSEVTSTNKKE